MAARTPMSLDFGPGVVKSQSSLTTPARYTDCLNVRFWHNRPQKWGGWTALPINITLAGIVRGSHTWGDQTSRQIIAAGSTEKLYAIADADYIANDITPIVATFTIANPISTTNASTEVIITLTAHGAVIGQYIDFAAGVTAVGGVIMLGSYKITRVVDANHVAVQVPAAATSTAGPGGGASVPIQLELTPGLVDPAQGFGWGAGVWNAGTWDTPRTASGIYFTPRIWSFSNFGKILLACAGDGPIYAWNPTIVPIVRAAVLGFGPTLCTGVVVTSDAIVVAYGTNQSGTRDLMEVWYSAQGDYLNWDITALAGANGSPSRVNRLREGTQIVRGVDLGVHVTLLWTNTALYALQYTGSQYVFNTQLVGTACGLIAPLAMTVVGQVVYWMDADSFHLYSGSVQPIPNADDISEWVFNQIRFQTKTVSWYNKRYGEVYWAFCSQNSSEPDTYVCYNIEGKFWTNGMVVRTAATAFKGIDARPILFGANGKVYRHDDGVDADGAALPWSLMVDGIDMMTGEVLMEVDGFAADMARQVGSMQVDFSFYDRTPAGESIEDAATITLSPTQKLEDVRGAGRELAITYSGGVNVGDDFRMGTPRLQTYPGAERA
jgi:hypothetical protein